MKREDLLGPLGRKCRRLGASGFRVVGRNKALTKLGETYIQIEITSDSVEGKHTRLCLCACVMLV